MTMIRSFGLFDKTTEEKITFMLNRLSQTQKPVAIEQVTSELMLFLEQRFEREKLGVVILALRAAFEMQMTKWIARAQIEMDNSRIVSPSAAGFTGSDRSAS